MPYVLASANTHLTQRQQQQAGLRQKCPQTDSTGTHCFERERLNAERAGPKYGGPAAAP